MSEARRILVAGAEIGRQLYDLADGLRQQGHRVETAILARNPQHPDLKYDYILHQSPFSTRVNEIQNAVVRYPRGLFNSSYRMMRLLPYLTYDIYIFQYGVSLLPWHRDFPLLKRLGKKIISIFNGDDIRHWSASEPVWESFGLRLPRHYRENARLYPLDEKLRTLRMAEKYSDTIYSIPSQSELAVRPYMHTYLAINPSLYTFRVPGREIPTVVHAPSFRKLKGTEEIMATLERLRAEGVGFDLRLLEGKTNKEVIKELAEADVLVDQLNVPLYGMLALEGMATGCAVAGGNNYEFIPLPPNRPVLHIESGNLYSQLKRLLTDRGLRLELAGAGRSLVETYHDHRVVSRDMLQCLESGEGLEYDYYPGYFAREYVLPEGEFVSTKLKRMTAEIVCRWGLPEDVNPQDLVSRGLMSGDELDASTAIPRWKVKSYELFKTANS